MDLSKLLFTYLISTGDLSRINMFRIIDDYVMHNNEITNVDVRFGTLSSITVYFKNYVFPLIVEKYKKDNQKVNDLSLSDHEAIYKSMVITTSKNKFVTHSFSGALYDEVLNYGLDINRELFKKECSFLSYYGVRSPFSSGGLYLTDLSYHTIGYTLGTPEKIRISFSSLTDLIKRDDETLYDFHKRVIDIFKYENDDLENIDELIRILNSINDFYFTNDDTCVAVAYKYEEEDIKPYMPELFEYSLDSTYAYKELLEKDTYFSDLFYGTKESLNDRTANRFDILEVLLENLTSRYPNSVETQHLKKQLEYDYFYNVTRYGLSCYDNANGEGFMVESGKVDKDKIAVARFKNPTVTFEKMKCVCVDRKL